MVASISKALGVKNRRKEGNIMEIPIVVIAIIAVLVVISIVTGVSGWMASKKAKSTHA